MPDVILNRSGAQVKNLSARRDGEILRRLAPQNDTHQMRGDKVLKQSLFEATVAYQALMRSLCGS